MKDFMLEHYEVIWNFTEILGILDIVECNYESGMMDEFDSKLADILFSRV